MVLCAVGVVLQNGSLATEDISTNAEDLMSGQADQYRSDEMEAWPLKIYRRMLKI